MLRSFNRFALNSLAVLMLMYFSMTAAWYGAYSNYFFYPIIYQLTDVQGTVLEEAPGNTRGRSSFVYAGSGYHMKIFAEILQCLERGGDGLSEITYPAEGGRAKFFTDEELAFVQDIADFISLYKSFMPLMILLFLCVTGAMVYGSVWPFTFGSVGWFVMFFGGAFLLWGWKFGLVSALGVVRFFIFPAGHQWSFSHSESLLSLLVRVPDVFASLGGVMVFMFLVVFFLLYAAFGRLLKSIVSRYR